MGLLRVVLGSMRNVSCLQFSVLYQEFRGSDCLAGGISGFQVAWRSGTQTQTQKPMYLYLSGTNYQPRHLDLSALTLEPTPNKPTQCTEPSEATLFSHLKHVEAIYGLHSHFRYYL